MKDFLKRNRPVFTIGLATLVLFVVLIIISRARKTVSPGLVPVTDTKVVNAEIFEDPEADTSAGSVSEEPTEVEEKIEILQIEYTEDGFFPKNTKAVKGQLVRWVNKTDTNIYLEQIMNIYDELESPILVSAHDSFEFRLTKNKLWTYREKDTESFGSIFVLEASF